MTTPEFLKLGGRPSSPALTSWFEFLLQPELLNGHLENERSIPGPCQLIIQFLQQAKLLEAVGADSKLPDSMVAQTNGPEDHATLPTGNKKDNKEEKEYYGRKAKALKLLALEAASYLRWDVKNLMNKIPGPSMHQLLKDLINVCTGKQADSDDFITERLTDESLSDQTFFSLLTYQRWCLHTVLQDCMPKKPVKANAIPVPGLTEPVIQMVGISEERLNQIKKLFGKCKAVLSEVLSIKRSALMMTNEIFVFQSSALGEVNMQWDKGKLLPYEKWASMVAYDLGCVYFYESDYYKALDMFTKVENWASKIEGNVNDLYDQKKLEGYLKACRAIVKKVKYEDNLINQFTECITHRNIQKLNNTLLTDFSKRDLPSSACDQAYLLLKELQDDPVLSINEETMKLECLCAVIYVLRGDPFHVSTLCLEKGVKLWSEIIEEANKHTTLPQKKSLALFVAGLATRQESLLEQTVIRDLLVHAPSLAKKDKMDTDSNTPSLLAPHLSELDEPALVLCYDPEKIWTILCSIHARSNIKVVVDFWKLPKELDRLFNDLPLELNTVCAFVLIVKAKELIASGEFNRAVVLLSAADKTIRDISGKIAKIIRWEVLYANLLATKVYGEDPGLEINKKVKSCLYSLKVESEIYPHDKLVMECVAYLLLNKDWEYLSSLHDTRVGFTEYARQLINVCKELPGVEHAKVPGKVLWDTSIVIFALQNTGKRVRLGNQSMLPKDKYKKFLLTIKEPLVLSVLVSLLTRMYNLKNTDTDIDRANNFSAVWPDSLPPAVTSSLDEGFIKETLVHLVQHALTVNSMESTWLKTYAEIQYAVGNMRDAIKYYLLSASVSSNHFVQQVPIYVFDAEVFMRLIKCCVSLRNFTQAVVLCQFFEEPDYAAAFKYLQEKSCQDGMDIYYDCLWDINIMEFLVHLHDKRGEVEKKQLLIQLIGNPEINSNNPEAILQTAKSAKKSKFLQKMAEQYT